jgi:hypothetical protein
MRKGRRVRDVDGCGSAGPQGVPDPRGEMLGPLVGPVQDAVLGHEGMELLLWQRGPGRERGDVPVDVRVALLAAGVRVSPRRARG